MPLSYRKFPGTEFPVFLPGNVPLQFGLIVVAKGGAFIDKVYCICCFLVMSRTMFHRTRNGLEYLSLTMERVQSFGNQIQTSYFKRSQHEPFLVWVFFCGNHFAYWALLALKHGGTCLKGPIAQSLEAKRPNNVYLKPELEAAFLFNFTKFWAQNLLSKSWILVRLLFEGGYY